MSEDLKPCPFCGAHEVSLSTGQYGTGEKFRYVECESCGASSHGDLIENKTVAAWNTRTISRAELEKALLAAYEVGVPNIAAPWSELSERQKLIWRESICAAFKAIGFTVEPDDG